MGLGREGNGLFLPAERTVSQTQLLRAWTQPAVSLLALGLEKPGNTPEWTLKPFLEKAQAA